MATHPAKSFTHVDDLWVISPERLVRLFTPYAEYLLSRGFDISKLDVEMNSPSFEALTSLLLNPDPNMPGELIESLNIIREMADKQIADHLLRQAAELGIPPDKSYLSPADLAASMWLHDRRALERMHAERHMVKPCTFVYYQAGKPSPTPFVEPSDATVHALEHDLDHWFRANHRGRCCRVFCSTRKDGVWFLIRHGAYFKRDNCIENGMLSCVGYRPVQYDVVIYQPAMCELQISTETAKELNIYRKLFGRHLFGDDHHFPGTKIFTLEPLRTDGRRALVCTDVDGMDLVEMQMLRFCSGSTYSSFETVDSHDVFRYMQANNKGIPPKARLSEACLSIHFSDSKTPRCVLLRPSNIIQYERDSDCEVVEPWLRLRHFAMLGHLLMLLPLLHNVLTGLDYAA